MFCFRFRFLVLLSPESLCVSVSVCEWVGLQRNPRGCCFTYCTIVGVSWCRTHVLRRISAFLLLHARETVASPDAGSTPVGWKDATTAEYKATVSGSPPENCAPQRSQPLYLALPRSMDSSPCYRVGRPEGSVSVPR